MVSQAKSSNRVIVLKTTYPSPVMAKHVAKEVVREGFAACTQVIKGVTSFFRWEGKVQSAHEYILLCKTSPQMCQKLKDKIREGHPYDTPEILLLEADADEAYVLWLNASCKA